MRIDNGILHSLNPRGFTDGTQKLGTLIHATQEKCVQEYIDIGRVGIAT